MGLLDRIFGGSHKREATVIEAPPCPHLTLIPRWDSADDIGKADLASSFTCEACGQTFTPDEAQGLRDSQN
jgi:hypothetical protein